MRHLEATILICHRSIPKLLRLDYRKLIWRHLGDNIFLCHSCSLESMRNFNCSCKLSWRHLRDILSCHSSSNFGSMSLHYRFTMHNYISVFACGIYVVHFLIPTRPEEENRHEVPPLGSDITLNNGMENKTVWNAISDVNCALQACSSPGADIHWPYGEMDEPLFDIPFFSGKIDSSGLPYNREMDQRLNTTHQPMFRIPFYSGKIGSSSLPAPVIDLYPEPSALYGKPRRRGPDKGKRKPRGPRKQ